MSQENVETMRRTMDAFTRADKAAWLAEHDPDVVMIPAARVAGERTHPRCGCDLGLLPGCNRHVGRGLGSDR